MLHLSTTLGVMDEWMSGWMKEGMSKLRRVLLGLWLKYVAGDGRWAVEGRMSKGMSE